MRINQYTNQPNNKPKCVYSNFSAATEIDTLKVSSSLITPKKANIGSAVTIATLASVCGIFMFSRGFQKHAGKYLNKFKEYLEGKRDLSTLKDSDNKTKFYEYVIGRINSFIKKSESINNITSLKDILFMKLMYKSEPTKKIHTSITEYFEKLSYKTVLNSYKKTEDCFKKMNSIFDELDKSLLKESPDEIFIIDGEKHTKKELIEKAQFHRDIANTMINTFMSKETLKGRYDYLNEVTSTLYSNFWDVSFKDFWSKDNKFKRKEMWQTFIAAEQIKGDKTSMAINIAKARNAISYTSADKTEFMNDYISKLDGIVPPDDKKGMDIINKLDWFAKHPEGIKNNKELFLNYLGKLKNHKFVTSDKNLAKTQEECKKAYIDVVEELIDDPSKGALQDMLDIYYKIAPFKIDESGALLAIKKAVKSFDKSVELESVEFFDKIRDLRLGSAPTDVLTIVFSFISLSIGLGYAKDKDKRTSIMLKSGIPIVGGIATATLTATKLVSGGKSLALGFLSGIILNQLGKIADNIRKNKHLENIIKDDVIA